MSELIKGIGLNQNTSNFDLQKWKLALEISKVGIWDYNSDTDQISFTTPSKTIIGTQDNINFGKNATDWNDRVHPEDRQQYYQDFKDHLNGLKPLYENKHRVLHKDGSYRWILDRGKIIEKDKHGEASRIIGTHVDITEFAESEKKVEETLDLVVKQNNKLQNFAHIVTHNLKQHAGNFESLLGFYEEANTEDEKIEMLDYLKTLSKSLTKTINNLNEIVTVQSRKKNTENKLCICKEIDLILQELDYYIHEQKASIITDIKTDCFINFNTSYFQSITQNLITNSIKYRHKDRNPIIKIRSKQVGDMVQIEFTDNGCGIDLDKFGKDIFGLYKTFHNNTDSEGVGLYLVKNQIEAFNGTIDIKSKVNKGTTFTIKIPN